MNPRLSIIIPTLGRPSIHGTLASIYNQMEKGDEVIVVGDGHRPLAKKAALFLGFSYLETDLTKEWGHAQRNLGMSRARGDYLAFMDDDDYYLPSAFSAMKKGASESPMKPLLFRVEDGSRIIWEDMTIRFSNVSTQMFIIPNVPGKYGKWQRNAYTKNGKGGDYRFICDTLALYAPSDLVYRPEIIARIPVHSDGK